MESISILMSLYKHEKPEFLQLSLNSILKQDNIPYELVLVEDGPLTLELYSVLEWFEKQCNQFHRIKLLQNMGLGRALEEGLKHCTNELVVRMDTDDIAKPDRFLKQIEFMQAHPEIDICSSWVDEFLGDITNVVSTRIVPETHEEISKFIKFRSPLNHPAVIFRKSAVEKAGGYQHFPLFEDWFLWVRMIINGSKFANIQESLLYFRTSPDMFRRRGGWQYAKDSAKFQWKLHELGLTSIFQAITASILRGGVYIMPNRIREIIYKKFLR